jgi:hypothetical protein
LRPLIGEWALEAIPPGGEPWPGEARTTFEWHDSRAHVIQRWTIDLPEAPDGNQIIGCDAANSTYQQLYSDDCGACRVYGMSIDDDEWKLWREGEPLDRTACPKRAAIGTLLAAKMLELAPGSIR